MYRHLSGCIIHLWQSIIVTFHLRNHFWHQRRKQATVCFTGYTGRFSMGKLYWNIRVLPRSQVYFQLKIQSC